MKFLVTTREVHTRVIEIEAEDEEQAIMMVKIGGGEFADSTKHDYTLDSDKWTIEKKD